MKKIFIGLVLAFASLTSFAQIYPGLKNTTTFDFGTDSCYWRARVGAFLYYRTTAGVPRYDKLTNGFKVNSTCSFPYRPTLSGDINILSPNYRTQTQEPADCLFTHFDAGGQRFRIITMADDGIDNYTMSAAGTGLQRIPAGFTSSIRLGDAMAVRTGSWDNDMFPADTNDGSAYQKSESSEALFYTMHVRADNPIVKLHYAMVSRFPASKVTGWVSGELVARVVVQNPNGTWPSNSIADSSKWMRVQMPFGPYANDNRPYTDTIGNYKWLQGANENSGSCQYRYRPWDVVTIDLTNYIDKTVRLEVYNSDANFYYSLYSYLAFDYEPSAIVAYGCTPDSSDATDTLYAPQGMYAYKWFVSANGKLDLSDTAAAMAAPLRLLQPAAYGGSDDDSTFIYKFAPHYEDFRLPDNSVADTQTFCCMMFSTMNGRYIDSSKIFINIANQKPAADFDFESPCGGPISLHNTTPNQPDIDSDTSSTEWLIYDDTLATTPIDTLYSRDTTYAFEREGWYKIVMRAYAHDRSCVGAKTKHIRALHGAVAAITTATTSVCAGDYAMLHSPDDSLIVRRLWVVNGSEYESTIANSYDSLQVLLPLGPSEIKLYITAGNGCTDSTRININVYGTPTLSFIGNADAAVCPGDSAMLNAVGTYAPDNRWTSTPHDPMLDNQQGRATIIVKPDTTTVYTLLAPENSSCGQQDKSITLKVIPPPVPAVRLSNTFVNTGHPVIFAEDVSRYGHHTSWVLSDSTRSNERFIRHTFTDLSVDVVKITMRSCNVLNCCSSDTTITFPIEPATTWAPNVFTPDRDNNKLFSIVFSQKVYDYELYIYNRKGQLVFQSTDQDEKWDGTIDGTPCPSGSYVYYLRYCFSYNGTRHHTKGTVTLVR